MDAASSEVFDCLVIGAGVAGLTAAQSLTAAGLKVLVLEAKDRLGGRVHTVTLGGQNLDLGATFVHGDRENPLTAAVADASGPGYLIDDDAIAVFERDGRPVSSGRCDAGWREYRQLLSQLPKVPVSAGQAKSVAAAIAACTPAKGLDAVCRWYLGYDLVFTLGATLDKVSLKFGANDRSYKGGDLLPTAGFASWVATLATGLRIRQGMAVDRVVWDQDGVTVTAGGTAKLRGRRVIVTAPLGVLQAGGIRFQPPLPRPKVAAMGRLAMGATEKIAIRFGECFWQPDQDLLAFLDDEAVGHGVGVIINGYKVWRQPILVAFAYGAYAESWSQRSDEALVAAFCQQLAAAYPEGVKRVPVVGYDVSRWGADPWIRGSYSYAPVGSLYGDFSALAAPVGATVFFAGEATSQEYRGTLHGAAASGHRAAAEVRASLAGN